MSFMRHFSNASSLDFLLLELFSARVEKTAKHCMNIFDFYALIMLLISFFVKLFYTPIYNS